MPIPNHPTTKYGRIVAAENDLRVLSTVRHFGYLRRHEIAMAVWPKSTPKSSYIMACRTVTRLIKDGKLVDRPNSLGGMALILTNKGVSSLRDVGIDAQDGYDLNVNGPQFFHRTMGTNYLLEKARYGDEVFGEYAILKGWSTLDLEMVRRQFHKIPDGLILHSGAAHGLRPGVHLVDWVEVESGFKSYEDVKKAFMLVSKGAELSRDGNLILNKLVFVFDSRNTHENRLLQYLKKFLAENLQLSADLVMEAIILVRCYLDVPLTWHGIDEATAADRALTSKNKVDASETNLFN
ncbi:MAG: hypothetical protein Q7S87_16350 [Agitococcus sp.]|nr:hypothetical protein [Agitococcus sp.]MDO9176950.1 hypothetical protein [Agitococcus sp.]